MAQYRNWATTQTVVGKSFAVKIFGQVAFMLSVSKKNIIVKLRPIRSWREEFTILCEQATGHGKLIQEAKSDKEHCFSNETRVYLKQSMGQQGFTQDNMKFYTWGPVYFTHFWPS